MIVPLSQQISSQTATSSELCYFLFFIRHPVLQSGGTFWNYANGCI